MAGSNGVLESTTTGTGLVAVCNEYHVWATKSHVDAHVDLEATWILFISSSFVLKDGHFPMFVLVNTFKGSRKWPCLFLVMCSHSIVGFSCTMSFITVLFCCHTELIFLSFLFGCLYC